MRQARDVRRVIGYVPQALSAGGSLTGFENLLIFAKLCEVPDGERDKRIRGALELMGLRDAGNKLVRTYSGGMIRRLEVAQAMLHFPQVLFLSIFYGIAVIWERDLGVIHKSLASPTPRWCWARRSRRGYARCRRRSSSSW